MITVNEITLTDEQLAAVETLARCDKDVQTLGGYAGTGKSTVIKELATRLPHFAVCAYTGKAAQVLNRKGMHASTIHSLIYRPVENGDDVRFELVPSYELSLDGFIVDEASMVGRDIYHDLLSFGKPIIFVGDHGQLEPVKSDGLDLMKEPDIVLEKIHRNAGEIAHFAEHLRKGGAPTDWTASSHEGGGGEGRVEVITGRQLGDLDIQPSDQMICAYNRTRHQMNRTVRDFLGLPADTPVVGDRIMCLQNDRELGVFNGMQGTITRIDHARLTFDFNGRQIGHHRYHRKAFGGEPKDWRRSFGVIPFDWSYCVTAHKMQGDEADNVIVLEQRCDLWSHQRWCYTAASRARKKLIWVLA